MLFQAGDPGDSLIIVRVGQIELIIKDKVGQKIVLHAAQPGDMFGELGDARFWSANRNSSGAHGQ